VKASRQPVSANVTALLFGDSIRYGQLAWRSKIERACSRDGVLGDQSPRLRMAPGDAAVVPAPVKNRACLRLSFIGGISVWWWTSLGRGDAQRIGAWCVCIARSMGPESASSSPTNLNEKKRSSLSILIALAILDPLSSLQLGCHPSRQQSRCGAWLAPPQRPTTT
jgi:hypothetical protein